MLLAEDMNWISIPQLKQPMRVKAKTRYRQAEQWAAVYPEQHGRVRLEFDVPQRAVTVGQAVVLYDGDVVVGGGHDLPGRRQRNADSQNTGSGLDSHMLNGGHDHCGACCCGSCGALKLTQTEVDLRRLSAQIPSGSMVLTTKGQAVIE